jgi:hypothetical protein
MGQASKIRAEAASRSAVDTDVEASDVGPKTYVAQKLEGSIHFFNR